MRYANIEHSRLANDIHAENIVAGWWTDLATGQSIIATRNRPEMLMLTVSELSEASEARWEEAMDDKLPQFAGFDVELADAAIRLYDLLGAEAGTMVFDRAVRDKYTAALGEAVPSQIGLMLIVNQISRAMEGYRKGNREKYLDGLWGALGRIWALAQKHGDHNLMEVIGAKRRFNRERADHKIENRLKDGGKAF